MSPSLPLAARRQAERIRHALRSGQPDIAFSARQMRGPALQALLRWCDAQGIGQPLGPDGSWRFAATDLVPLEDSLRQLGLRPLNEAAAPTRIGRLAQGAEEHKRLGEQPLAHRILCSQVTPCAPLPMRARPARWAIDVDWRQLDLAAFTGLLVVENADVFYACGGPDWRLPEALQHALITYRGHDYRSTGLKALQRAWPPTGGARVYFGDLDPPGVRIGLNEGYTHLLLPEIDAFRRAATRAHVPAEQSRALQWLQMDVLPAYPADHPLTPYLRILAQGRGLLQQAALHLPMALVCTAPTAG